MFLLIIFDILFIQNAIDLKCHDKPEKRENFMNNKTCQIYSKKYVLIALTATAKRF